MAEPGLIMGRKAASPSTDRNAAETRRGDSRHARRQIAQPRIGVADVERIRHRDRHPARLSPVTPVTRDNKSCPQVIDDFPHPIPVLERELDAIEMYLGPLIDKMLQPQE